MPLPTYDPADYAAQLATKVAHFRDNFAELGVGEPEVFASEPRHYRMRVEFGVWHDGDKLDFTMSDPDDPKQRVFLDTFPPAATRICEVMPALRERLMGSEVLRRRLFRVDFLATLSGELLITLIYHRKLAEDWETAARTLASELNVQILGRSRG
jgi:tRNA (uracil-5-)-methyltransferase